MKPSICSTLILLILLSACSPPEPAPASTLPAASPSPSPSPIEPTATEESPPSPEPGAGESAVIILRQEGGFAGVENEWTVYENGRIVTMSGEELQVEPEEVTATLAAIEQAGFFDLEQTEPSDICCDFFTYTLIVQNEDLEKVVVISEGDPNFPQALSDSFAAVQVLILSASE